MIKSQSYTQTKPRQTAIEQENRKTSDDSACYKDVKKPQINNPIHITINYNGKNT